MTKGKLMKIQIKGDVLKFKEGAEKFSWSQEFHFSLFENFCLPSKMIKLIEAKD